MRTGATPDHEDDSDSNSDDEDDKDEQPASKLTFSPEPPDANHKPDTLNKRPKPRKPPKPLTHSMATQRKEKSNKDQQADKDNCCSSTKKTHERQEQVPGQTPSLTTSTPCAKHQDCASKQSNNPTTMVNQLHPLLNMSKSHKTRKSKCQPASLMSKSRRMSSSTPQRLISPAHSRTRLQRCLPQRRSFAQMSTPKTSIPMSPRDDGSRFPSRNGNTPSHCMHRPGPPQRQCDSSTRHRSKHGQLA